MIGGMLGVMPAQLRAAAEAVGVALDALRAAPESPAVRGAVDQATAAVAVLTPDLTAQALRCLVLDIEACHLAGVAESPRLAAALRLAAVALHIDPRTFGKRR
jgi:hypothetical protein